MTPPTRLPSSSPPPHHLPPGFVRFLPFLAHLRLEADQTDAQTSLLTMSGLPLNSGDLKSGRTLSSRRSGLSLRSSPTISVERAESVRSPVSPAFYSPMSQYAPSPVTDNFNHFSTLPPDFVASPDLSAPRDGSALAARRASASAAYPTPPGSAPGSSRFQGSFGSGGAQLSLVSSNCSLRRTLILLSSYSRRHDPVSLSRRRKVFLHPPR